MTRSQLWLKPSHTLGARAAKFGPDHPLTLTALNDLALAYLATGKLTEAIGLLGQALERQERGLGAGVTTGSCRGGRRSSVFRPVCRKRLAWGPCRSMPVSSETRLPHWHHARPTRLRSPPRLSPRATGPRWQDLPKSRQEDLLRRLGQMLAERLADPDVPTEGKPEPH